MAPVLSLAERGILMSTYEALMTMIAFAALIISVVNTKISKAALISGKE